MTAERSTGNKLTINLCFFFQVKKATLYVCGSKLAARGETFGPVRCMKLHHAWFCVEAKQLTEEKRI